MFGWLRNLLGRKAKAGEAEPPPLPAAADHAPVDDAEETATRPVVPPPLPGKAAARAEETAPPERAAEGAAVAEAAGGEAVADAAAAGEAAPATEASPATAEPAEGEPPDGLSVFINDFLQPIVADGQFQRQLEETPLIVAFHVYQVLDQIWRLGPAAVDERIREAVRTATQTRFRPTPEQLERSWDRICGHRDKMTENEYAGVQKWFQAEARKLDYEMDFPVPDAAVSFRDQPLDNKHVEGFFRVFREAGVEELRGDVEAAAGADAAAPAAVAEPPEPPPPPPPEAQVVDAACLAQMTAGILNGSLADELQGQAAGIVAGMEELLAGERLPGLAFDRFRENRAQQAVIVGDSPAGGGSLWFLGDVHGDLLGLQCAFQYIDGWPDPEPPTVVLLGDLFDDGDLSYEALLLVYRRILDDPARVCVIAGNHDEGLTADKGSFRSSVMPSNFTDWLNARREDETARRLGQLTVEFFRQAPRALFLPDGLVAVHGGVPHSDLQKNIAQPQDLNSFACLQDFVWTRLHQRAKKRFPNRTTRGCELGREDFERFCEKTSQVIGQPVERIVRGHDHVDHEDRYALFSAYAKNPVLTINNMCSRLPREVFGPYEHRPCLARWVPGAIPEVHRLMIPAEAVRQMYPPASEAAAETEAAE